MQYQEMPTIFKPRMPKQVVLEGEHLPAFLFKEWDQGLPRTINPETDTDDTEAIKLQCELAYKIHPFANEQQIINLRRGLYFAICKTRKTHVGYVLDKQVEKQVVRPLVLQ